MDNALYELWASQQGRRWQRLEELKEGKKFTDHRWEATHTMAWAVPDDEAIAICVKYSPLVEIGAGAGYWAALIEDAGGDIRAYDRAPLWGTRHNNFFRQDMVDYVRVWQGGPEKLRCKVNEDRTLFLCWPPYTDPMAANCLTHFPRRVIYVGEGEYGCNADERFFKLLDDYYDELLVHDIPQWEGLHDRLYVYERKEGRFDEVVR